MQINRNFFRQGNLTFSFSDIHLILEEKCFILTRQLSRSDEALLLLFYGGRDNDNKYKTSTTKQAAAAQAPAAHGIRLFGQAHSALQAASSKGG
jgi:hypothetical protein